jgi:hypothetical protein
MNSLKAMRMLHWSFISQNQGCLPYDLCLWLILFQVANRIFEDIKWYMTGGMSYNLLVKQGSNARGCNA